MRTLREKYAWHGRLPAVRPISGTRVALVPCKDTRDTAQVEDMIVTETKTTQKADCTMEYRYRIRYVEPAGEENAPASSGDARGRIALHVFETPKTIKGRDAEVLDLVESVARNGNTRIILDMNQTERLDSGNVYHLALLQRTCAQRGSHLVLVPSEHVRPCLEQTELLTMIDTAEDYEDAEEYLRKAA